MVHSVRISRKEDC